MTRLKLNSISYHGILGMLLALAMTSACGGTSKKVDDDDSSSGDGDGDSSGDGDGDSSGDGDGDSSGDGDGDSSGDGDGDSSGDGGSSSGEASSGGSGGSGGEAGDSGGSAAGGAEGDSSTGGANNVGGIGGADVSSGGTPSGGSGATGNGGSAAIGGSTGSGGTSSAGLVTLGEACPTPGTFACADANQRLALVCGGESKWEIRETCAGELRCDYNAGPELGTCRAILPECAPGEEPLFCEGRRIAECKPGGFETQEAKTCPEWFGCGGNGECVPIADECLDPPVGGCASDCDTEPQWCIDTIFCERGEFDLQIDETTSPVTMRLPSHDLCDRCSEDRPSVTVIDELLADLPLRITVGPGWEMNYDLSQTMRGSCLDLPVERCLVVEQSDDVRWIFFTAQTEPPLERNVVFELVPPGTTCP